MQTNSRCISVYAFLHSASHTLTNSWRCATESTPTTTYCSSVLLLFFFLNTIQKTLLIRSAAFPFPTLPPSHCHSSISHTQPFPSVWLHENETIRSSKRVQAWYLCGWWKSQAHKSLVSPLTENYIKSVIKLLTLKISIHNPVSL